MGKLHVMSGITAPREHLVQFRQSIRAQPAVEFQLAREPVPVEGLHSAPQEIRIGDWPTGESQPCRKSVPAVSSNAIS